MINRIVVSGGWSYGNMGDEVIARCTVELLNRTFPDVEKIYTSFDVQDYQNVHNIPAVESVHAIFDRMNYGLSDIALCVSNPEEYHIKEFAELFQENTLFIMSGGGYFDGRWLSQFAARIVEIEVAKKYGARVAILGQSIGPLVSSQECELLRNAIELCDFINVRDYESRELLSGLVPGKAISCTSDIAITISDFIQTEREKEERKCNFIVQIYSDYVENSTNGKDRNTSWGKIMKRVLLRQYRYDFAWIRLLQGASKKAGYQCDIVLNVHQTGKIGNHHFEKYARKLVKMSQCEEIRILNCETVEEFCETLAGAEAIVSCKMHPLIISSSFGVRTYALSQHYKIDAFMKWIGRDAYCYRNLGFNPKTILNQIQNENSDLQKNTNEQISLRKQEVYQMFDVLYSMMYEKDKFY